MILSSSNRIIKAANVSKEHAVFNFIPPTDIGWQAIKENDALVDGAEDTKLPEGEPQKIILEAQTRAEEILKEAMEKAEASEAEAIEKGSRSGYEAGFKEGYETACENYNKEISNELEAFRKEIQETLLSVEQIKNQCLETYLEELKDIAVAVAEKVIHISLESSGEVIERMIVAEAEKLKKTAWVKIHIDKYDYDMVMESDGEMIDQLSHLSDNIQFIIMDKKEKGNCIIETPNEIVDVSVSTQIGTIKDLMENVNI